MYIDCHAHLFFSPIPVETIEEDIIGEIPTPSMDFIGNMIFNAKEKGVSHIVGVISNPNDFNRYQEQLEIENIIHIIGISRNNYNEDQPYLISLLEKELERKEEETKLKYLSEIIELKELLQKAYEDKDPKEGLKLILNNIENLFEEEQIKWIECVGKPFDHNYHHAISIIEKDDCKDDEIVEEIKKGYMLGDKPLRHSQVIVAKNKKR